MDKEFDMPRTRHWRLLLAIILIAGTQFVLAGVASAAPPVVKTVPWVATNPLIPHDTWSGKSIRLKGTADIQGAGISWTWDFGDGSAVATGTVSNMYAIEASHTYTGTAGTIFTARLTVRNTGTGEEGSKEYYVKIQTKTLPVEVNVAIDEGLWYLHKYQVRTSNYGYWNGSNVGSGYYAPNAANVNAFEVNGHLESGDAANPYTETVARGMKYLFTLVYQSAIPATRSFPAPVGAYNPDGNGNLKAVYVNQSYPFYQGGSFVDAIVASGTPSALTSTGPVGIIGRTYKDIVQDMVDGYAYCSYNGATAYGGWRYNCGDWPDNSPSQWGAIAIIPAVREWSVVVDPKVFAANINWLTYSYGTSGGAGFGYTDPNYYPWGRYAVTPSGMVQMVMDGLGRGNAMWDSVETFMRNNFGNAGGPTSGPKEYYYGLFSFVKALLLHNPPITMLQSSTPGVVPIDWYNAEVSKGDPTDGVARTLVGDQTAAGYWSGHNYSGDQYPFETAWAIIMLNRTVFTAGAPVAVAKAIPNPAVVGQMVTLDGSASFHQDPNKSITQWAWDLNGDGTCGDVTGPVVTNSWGALGTYPVKLCVTDNAGTIAETIVNVLVTIPPIAPTADAGGPYNFCLAPVGAAQPPFFLDGSRSVNPDEGQHQPGAYPGDTIYGAPSQFSWNLGTAFGDAIGVNPNVTAWFTGKGPGSYLIQLRVTDTTATSFPASGLPNLADTASGQVFVLAADNPVCVSCTVLTARAAGRQVQLAWTNVNSAGYAIYRSTVSGGPYLKIAQVPWTQLMYIDLAPAINTNYYYVVRPVLANTNERCQSNQVMARTAGR
jgi:PKD domain